MTDEVEAAVRKNQKPFVAAISLIGAGILLSSRKAKAYRPSSIVTHDGDGVALGSEIISEFEGFSAEPYLDPIGLATIGYGTTVYPGGEKVSISDAPISHETAVEYLNDYVYRKIIPALSSSIGRWGAFDNGEKAALISFAYNLGPNFYGRSGFKTISSALDSEDYKSKVPEAITLYDKAGGNQLAGLVRRRAYEAEVWRTGAHPSL